MSFDRGDIRRAMDVYTLDNEYLGTVLAIDPGPATRENRPPLEAGNVNESNGEMFGPMPTQTIGNGGPRTQSAAREYGVESDSRELIGSGAITVGKWWGLRHRRVISMDLVQTVSAERIVINRRLSALT